MRGSKRVIADKRHTFGSRTPNQWANSAANIAALLEYQRHYLMRMAMEAIAADRAETPNTRSPATPENPQPITAAPRRR